MQNTKSKILRATREKKNYLKRNIRGVLEDIRREKDMECLQDTGIKYYLQI